MGLVEPGRGDGLHPIGGPDGMKVMGLEDRAQQAPAIDVVIDDKNLGFHEEPLFKSSVAHSGVPDFL